MRLSPLQKRRDETERDEKGGGDGALKIRVQQTRAETRVETSSEKKSQIDRLHIELCQGFGLRLVFMKHLGSVEKRTTKQSASSRSRRESMKVGYLSRTICARL